MPTGSPAGKALASALVTTRSPSCGSAPAGQCCSRGRAPLVPTIMARARLPSSATGMRLLMSVASSTRAERVADLGHPAGQAAVVQRDLALADAMVGPAASSTARA